MRCPATPPSPLILAAKYSIGAAARPWHFSGDGTRTIRKISTLAADFPPATREDWRKLVDGVLKGAPFERLDSKTYDGLTIEPLYRADAASTGRSAARARRAPGRSCSASIIPTRRSPMPRRSTICENGATGLVLVFAGSVSANGYRPRSVAGDAQARARRRRSHRRGDRSQSSAGDAGRGPRSRRARQGAAVSRRQRSICASASIRSAALPRPDAGRGAWPKTLRRILPRWSASLRRPGFRGPFAVADGRVVHNAGGSEAQELAFVLAERGRLSARARSRRHDARCRARGDLFPTVGGCRPVPDHREVPRRAETVGARRGSLRADAEAGHCHGRDRLAHDDASTILT